MSAARTSIPSRGIRPPTHRPGQRGQALIEFSLLVTFMLFLTVGVTDIATLIDAHLNVVLAARTGARTGAVLGQGTPTIDPDCAIVGAVHAALANNPDVQIQQITIYQALPNGASSGFADIYNGTTTCNSAGVWQSGGPTAGPNGLWTGSPTPPFTARDIDPLTEDSVGVTVQYQFTWRFNLFGTGTLQLADTSVFPLNVSGQPTPIPT